VGRREDQTVGGPRSHWNYTSASKIWVVPAPGLSPGLTSCAIVCSCQKRLGTAHLSSDGTLGAVVGQRGRKTNANVLLAPSLPYSAWASHREAQTFTRYRFRCDRPECRHKQPRPVRAHRLTEAVRRAVAARRSVRFGRDL
jgi:hypothetical protein